jgi:hypothetical protein
MGIIDRKEIEENIEKDFTEALEDILPDDEDLVLVDIVNDTLDFDGNIEQMDDSEPLVLNIRVSGTISPMNDLTGGNDDEGTENAILPFHFDPILPVRRIERTIDLQEAKDWDLDIKISIPSGIGLKAWIGKGDEHKIRELEIDTSDGHPTIYLDISPGEADHITIQVEVGAFLLVNNVGACFGCLAITLIIILLLFLLVVLKIVRKKRRKKQESSEMGSEEGQKEGNKTKEGKKDGKLPEKGKEHELSWDG